MFIVTKIMPICFLVNIPFTLFRSKIRVKNKKIFKRTKKDLFFIKWLISYLKEYT